MADLLQRVIDNNVGVYQAVFGQLGIKLHVTPDIAYTKEKTPTYYSNAVTRSERWRPDTNFHYIATTARKNEWADWSIKDSYDVLDLAPLGFKRLFRATWIHLDPFHVRQPSRPLRFEVVRDQDNLSRWRQAWDADLELGQSLFSSRLLSDPDLYFVAGYDNERLACGCLFNRTGDVLGMSNFFAHDEARGCWAAIVSFIFNRLGPAGLVGYARDNVLADFQAIGFNAIGSLSVWHCPAGPEGPA